jgi:hypothetical protein
VLVGSTTRENGDGAIEACAAHATTASSMRDHGWMNHKFKHKHIEFAAPKITANSVASHANPTLKGLHKWP